MSQDSPDFGDRYNLASQAGFFCQQVVNLIIMLLLWWGLIYPRLLYLQLYLYLYLYCINTCLHLYIFVSNLYCYKHTRSLGALGQYELNICICIDICLDICVCIYYLYKHLYLYLCAKQSRCILLGGLIASKDCSE